MYRDEILAEEAAEAAVRLPDRPLGEGDEHILQMRALERRELGQEQKGRSVVRLSPRSTAWELAIDLAIAHHEGRTAIGQVMVQGLRQWHIWEGEHDRSLPIAPSASRPKEGHVRLVGWWVVPQRVAARAIDIIEAAQECARQGTPPMASWTERQATTSRILYRWRRTGQWRRHAWHRAPVHSPAPARRKARGRPSPKKVKRQTRIERLRERFPGVGEWAGTRPAAPHRPMSDVYPPGHRRHRCLV